ncbi:MAG TPA: efflux RND transporter periplasmic adaptor subunit [Chlamydiales bacterium]|nr:efflux RND transporter periplasmic adaptor subunit [Chlamydiales bacterium]
MNHFGYILCCLLLTSCAEKKSPPPSPVYPVKTGTSQIKEMPLFMETLGHVEPIISIEIRSRIEGELTGIFFTEGQEVQKGDLLFTIDSKPYEAALKEAQGALDQSMATFTLAEEKVKRYKILAKDEYYSQIDYETLQANLAAAAGQVQQTQAALDKARIDLDYCWIYAPIEGMVGILNVNFGNLVAAPNGTSDPLITLNQMNPIYVSFSIPEVHLPHILRSFKTTLPVLAAYESFDEETFSGSLCMLDNKVDPQTGMIRLRANFENERCLLWPGQFVRTRLILSTLKNAVVIPFTAIQMTMTNPIVFVVKSNHTVEERKVKLGERIGNEIIILEGLKGEETIVIEGQINLFNGARVDESI